MSAPSLTRRLNALVYPYRYDALTFLLLGTVLTWFYAPLFQSGHIVFSDIDFPADGRRYLEQVGGLWNQRFNSPTMLNLPRLLYLLPAWLVSSWFQYDGTVLLKTFLVELIGVSAVSFYLFGKRLFSVYLGRSFDLTKTLVLAAAAFFYVTNPWFVIRIQHIFLLCGYSLLPLMLLFFFNAFDPRFQTQLIPRFSLFRIRPYRQNVFDLAALAFTISLMSAAIHYFFYGLVILFALGCLVLGKQLWILRDRQAYLRRALLMNALGKGALLGLFLGLFCAYWLLPYAGSVLTGMSVSQNNINVDDTLSLFSRHSDLLKVTALISYWWPMMDLDRLGSGFWLGASTLGALLVVGLFATLRFPAVLFFSLMTTFFIVAATGTTWEALAPWFIGYVTHVPVFGALFRDPNKLMGLAALGYSLLLAFGLVRSAQIGLGRPLARTGFLATLSLVVGLSTWTYLEPFHRHYLSGFYAPVPVPPEYEALNRDLEGGPRTLVVPVAEAMTRPDTGVATPAWNKNSDPEGPLKATGDFTIYNLQTNSLFHHEGNDPGVAQAFWFLSELMNRGLTDRVGDVIRPWGTPRLVYQSGYSGQEGKQAFHRSLLAQDKTLLAGPANSLFQVFETQGNQAANNLGFELIPRAIFTTQGLARTITFRNLTSQTQPPGGIFFASAATTQVLSRLRTGDRLEYTGFDDLWLSSLPEKHYVRLARQVTDGNPYLGWAQSSTRGTDWHWYLESLGLTHQNYEQDLGAGIAVTFAPARLDVPVYRRAGLKGDTVMDFNAMLRLNLFFRPDNPASFEVQASPQSSGNALPVVRGEIQSGESLENWEVAKTGLIDAREKNPYQFRIKVSGRGTNQIHFKVRFFDKDQNQLGITYVVSPSETMNFDGIDFYGEYVSPETSRYMRIEVLSYQRPEQKVFWWIHDLVIQDLSAYAVPNTIRTSVVATPGSPTTAWLRVLRSPAGGRLVIQARGNSDTWTVDTKDSRRTWFEWVKVGSFVPNSARQEFEIVNRAGFNAVNVLVVLAAGEIPALQAPIREAIRRSAPFLALEAETDFAYQGSLQSERNYPTLSLGSAIRGVDAVLRRRIEIPQEGRYRFSLRVGGPPSTTGIVLNLRRVADGEERTWPLPLASTSDTSPEWVVDSNRLEEGTEGYSRSLKKLNDELPGYQEVRSPWWNLRDGPWELELRLSTKEPALSTLSDLRPFDPGTVRDPAFAPEIAQSDCSDCETLEPWMVQQFASQGSLVLRYQPTCSCDWYIESSQKVRVRPDQELLVQFEARSFFLRERHTKLVWLSRDGQILGSTFVPEVEESRKSLWNRYELVARVPAGATSALFQLWGRGDKKRTAELEVRNYRIYPLDRLPLVDTVVWEQDAPDAPHQPPAILEVRPDGSGGYRLKLSAPSAVPARFLVAAPMTSSPVWRAYQQGKVQAAEPGFNGVRSAFWVQAGPAGTTEVEVRNPLTLLYLLGLVGLPLGLVIVWLFYRVAKHPLPLRRRILGRRQHKLP